MQDRITADQSQIEAANQPSPFDIYRAAVKLGLRGQEKKADGLVCNEYSGTFKGQEYSIRAYIGPGYDAVEILGPDIKVAVQNLWETEQSSAIQYQVIGTPPQNILEILTNLKPQN